MLPFAGGEPVEVTEIDGGVSEPAWSPDGNRIAFTALVDQVGRDERDAARSAPQVIATGPYRMEGLGRIGTLRKHLFVVSVEGGEATRLTDGDAFAASPAWAPDGRDLAYIDPGIDFALDPEAPVYRIPAGGGDPIRLIDDGRFHQVVRWSPDGEWLLTVASSVHAGGHAPAVRRPGRRWGGPRAGSRLRSQRDGGRRGLSGRAARVQPRRTRCAVLRPGRGLHARVPGRCGGRRAAKARGR
jgi:dipeptidyl aminopeptidase/acylaminoacyl peptidase